MILAESIEAAFCFFHQKERVYAHSTSPTQQEDIEYAIADYTHRMNPELLHSLAQGHPSFLLEHSSFASDLSAAVSQLEKMMPQKE